VFWLKKFFSFWLMPVPLCMALLVSGLLISRRRQRLGRCLTLAAAALLILFSNKFVSNRLVAPLEDRYPAIPEILADAPVPAQLAGCGFVVVLGGGHVDVPAWPAAERLSASSLGRIAEAVRILRVVPNARLIVSGPGMPGRPSHGAVLAEAARSLGVDPARITVIDTAHDTEDEAHAVARMAGKTRVALVTSAWHMPRAAALFRHAGVDFVPCPADFVAREGIRLTWDDFLWDSESLERSSRAAHEWIGLLWLKLRGVG
jgi:uncharacterized SAM-binding protein YcdF (DUF218 family)